MYTCFYDTHRDKLCWSLKKGVEFNICFRQVTIKLDENKTIIIHIR